MLSERELLVRRNFEAYRDLMWFEELEPKFRERGIDGKELQSFREAWNDHAEIRDWAWWQKESAGKANGILEDEIMDITDRLDALGCMRWLEEQKQHNQDASSSYRQILTDAVGRMPKNNNDKGIDP